MKTAVITLKVESKIKKQAQKAAEEFGISLSSLISGFLSDFIYNKEIKFSRREEIPSQYLIDAIKEAEEERKKGNFYSFSDSKDALKFLKEVREGKIKV
ncbi:MAG: type II toxin-antitoxin system RelB/DinJ family antitoxin [Patescibacteria group bacterium]